MLLLLLCCCYSQTLNSVHAEFTCFQSVFDIIKKKLEREAKVCYFSLTLSCCHVFVFVLTSFHFLTNLLASCPCTSSHFIIQTDIYIFSIEFVFLTYFFIQYQQSIPVPCSLFLVFSVCTVHRANRLQIVHIVYCMQLFCGQEMHKYISYI